MMDCLWHIQFVQLTKLKTKSCQVRNNQLDAQLERKVMRVFTRALISLMLYLSLLVSCKPLPSAAENQISTIPIISTTPPPILSPSPTSTEGWTPLPTITPRETQLPAEVLNDIIYWKLW